MTDQVEVTTEHKKEGSIENRPTYMIELEKKWVRWTGIQNEKVGEAIKDLTGDLWTELRKFQAITCRECEDRKLPEDFKEFLKQRIRDTWRDILEHQKIGMDKLGIVVRENLPEGEFDEEQE